MKSSTKTAVKHVFIVFCLCMKVFSVGASELPTLLFSATERQAIQQLRQTAAGLSNKQLVRHTGIVQRRDGKNVVWLNDHPTNAGDRFYPITRGTSVVLGGEELRVGDEFDTVNGIKRSLVPNDSIQKKKQK